MKKVRRNISLDDERKDVGDIKRET